jgi:hypothetical protein
MTPSETGLFFEFVFRLCLKETFSITDKKYIEYIPCKYRRATISCTPMMLYLSLLSCKKSEHNDIFYSSIERNKEIAATSPENICYIMNCATDKSYKFIDEKTIFSPKSINLEKEISEYEQYCKDNNLHFIGYICTKLFDVNTIRVKKIPNYIDQFIPTIIEMLKVVKFIKEFYDEDKMMKIQAVSKYLQNPTKFIIFVDMTNNAINIAKEEKKQHADEFIKSTSEISEILRTEEEVLSERDI